MCEGLSPYTHMCARQCVFSVYVSCTCVCKGEGRDPLGVTAQRLCEYRRTPVARGGAPCDNATADGAKTSGARTLSRATLSPPGCPVAKKYRCARVPPVPVFTSPNGAVVNSGVDGPEPCTSPYQCRCKSCRPTTTHHLQPLTGFVFGSQTVGFVGVFFTSDVERCDIGPGGSRLPCITHQWCADFARAVACGVYPTAKLSRVGWPHLCCVIQAQPRGQEWVNVGSPQDCSGMV